MWRLLVCICAMFHFVNGAVAIASEQLKPAAAEDGEFDNPVLPSEMPTPKSAKSAKSAKKASVKDHSQVVEPQEVSTPHAQGVQSSENISEPTPAPSSDITKKDEDSSVLIDSLDTPPPQSKSQGWVWFSIVGVVVLLLMFLIA